jgi:ABC-2 type transport system ATP-binding protein
LLELDGLTHHYGRVVALDCLTFSVAPGQMVGFVGPNGAGKTTAMRIVLGLLAPTEGRVRWNDGPIDDAVRRRFGYMPEERGLYPKMRVRDHLVYLGRLSGIEERDAGRRADEWIEKLGLADRAADRVEQLSLGNQQRVQLAAALIHDPRVLVLDEPFSGLDPVGVDVLSSVLREQVDGGVALVFSSHQLDLVERICDAVAIINRGRLVEFGRIEEIRGRHSRRLVRVDLDGAPEEWFGRLPGVELARREGNSVLLHLTDGTDDQRLLDAARAAGRVRHFGIERPRLAELFREVVAV